jgi:hypothetical protein
MNVVGGMNLPHRRGGRTAACIPLARLTVTDGRLAIRSRLAAGFIGAFEVPLESIRAAFPMRGRVVTVGIGLEADDGRTAWFWTYQGPALLAQLREHGVPVETETRRAAGVWWS